MFLASLNSTPHAIESEVFNMFNWQNTGRQKQHFEDSLARQEDRSSDNVGLCLLGCNQYECSQHFLVCPILHDAQIISCDLEAV